jgi:hypothetical protein
MRSLICTNVCSLCLICQITGTPLLLKHNHVGHVSLNIMFHSSLFFSLCFCFLLFLFSERDHLYLGACLSNHKEAYTYLTSDRVIILHQKALYNLIPLIPLFSPFVEHAITYYVAHYFKHYTRVSLTQELVQFMKNDIKSCSPTSDSPLVSLNLPSSDIFKTYIGKFFSPPTTPTSSISLLPLPGASSPFSDSRIEKMSTTNKVL